MHSKKSNILITKSKHFVDIYQYQQYLQNIIYITILSIYIVKSSLKVIRYVCRKTGCNTQFQLDSVTQLQTLTTEHISLCSRQKKTAAPS